MPGLSGQTVVGLGGSAGIGLATARQARAEGADVILVGRNAERLERAASDVCAVSSAAFDATDLYRVGGVLRRPSRAGPLMANVAPTPKAVALVLLPALVLMLALAFSYVGAFHDPSPHQVPVAVVGPPAVASQLNQRVQLVRPSERRCRSRSCLRRGRA
jgi:NAD(P)-dependent dehydrogenase (short-subunit alcohol dehydrogenase family)